MRLGNITERCRLHLRLGPTRTQNITNVYLVLVPVTTCEGSILGLFRGKNHQGTDRHAATTAANKDDAAGDPAFGESI